MILQVTFPPKKCHQPPQPSFSNMFGKFAPNKERIVFQAPCFRGYQNPIFRWNMQTTHEEIQFKPKIFVPKKHLKLQDVFGGFKSGL